eukprot:1956772-Pleurochrysis_carterae.AAC.3
MVRDTRASASDTHQTSSSFLASTTGTDPKTANRHCATIARDGQPQNELKSPTTPTTVAGSSSTALLFPPVAR